MTILTLRGVKRMKIKVTEFSIASSEYFDEEYAKYMFLLSGENENTKENLQKIISNVEEYYKTLECTFIGDWTSSNPLFYRKIVSLFWGKLQKYLPGMTGILGTDLTSFPQHGAVTERTFDHSGDEYGMTETSPITASLTSITTPDGKVQRQDNYTNTDNVTRDSADLLKVSHEVYAEYRNAVTIVDMCYRSLVEEYTKLY